jgi:hypothetical protein
MESVFDVPVATRTIISDISVKLDIETIFNQIPFLMNIPNYPCTIVAMYYKNSSKGDLSFLQDRKDNVSFRNAVNIIFRIYDQLINVKVSAHGNFQITGCKNKSNCYKVICYFIDLCKTYCPDVILSSDNSTISIIFYTVMTNIVFSTNFKIDKQKLNNLIIHNEKFYNLYETNFGYTGMNIKIPLGEDWRKFMIDKFTFSPQNQTWQQSKIVFDDYFTENMKEKKKNKQRFNTFLVFHSGKIIMSGVCEENMANDYNFFKKYLVDNRQFIEEKIEK